MAELMEFKCPCCGAPIEFNSEVQKMKCEYCSTEFDMDTLKSFDDDLKGDKADNMNWENTPGNEWREGETEGMRVYSCNSCGGEVVGDAVLGASSCPYCGSPVIMKGQFSGDLRPDYVIPFKLDKKAAKNGLLAHLKGKPFLPKVFKDENHIDEIKGVYVPFWLFDANVDAHVRYKGTKTRIWSDSNYNYTETSYFSVVRGGNAAFERVPVDGSEKMPDDLMESIEPFNFSEAVDFQTAYLAGYLADKYDVTSEQSMERANNRIKNSIESTLRSTTRGYETLIPENTNVNFSGGSSKYALYPVWILNTSWNGKKYLFAMNGQTGKFVGDLPVDGKKFALCLAGLTVLCTLGTTLVQWLSAIL